jgi:hypothetical protein
MDAVYNRYEQKYILTKTQRDVLAGVLEAHLSYDLYSAPGKPYVIRNIYYDTDDHAVIRHSVQKPVYKEKLRLRCYADPVTDDDTVYLEIKKKFKGRVNKRRLPMTYGDARQMMESGLVPDGDDQVQREIAFMIRSTDIRPGAVIRYRRTAFVSEDQSLRVTFDEDIMFYSKETVRSSKDGVFLPVLDDPDLVLLEIKSVTNFPLWLVRALSGFPLFSQSFSKYGSAYRTYIAGGMTDDPISDQR